VGLRSVLVILMYEKIAYKILQLKPGIVGCCKKQNFTI